MLRDAVRRRMLADVPLGAFPRADRLDGDRRADAGGERARVKTFCIGFPTRLAKPTSRRRWRRTSAPTTELYVTSEDAGDGAAAAVIDEPFADSSQIDGHRPRWRAPSRWRSPGTAATMFGGYTRHLWARRLAADRAAAAALRRAGRRRRPRQSGVWNALRRRPALRRRAAAAAARRQAAQADAAARRATSTRSVSCWRSGIARALPGATIPLSWAERGRRLVAEFAERMIFQDFTSHLSDDIREGRSRQHGGEPRGARAAARSPADRLRVAAAAVGAAARRLRKWLLRRIVDRHTGVDGSARPASRCRSATGCAVRCATGPSRSSRRRSSPARLRRDGRHRRVEAPSLRRGRGVGSARADVQAWHQQWADAGPR